MNKTQLIVISIVLILGMVLAVQVAQIKSDPFQELREVHKKAMEVSR